MRYVVHVVAIFAADESGVRQYDVWENAITVDAEGPRKALEDGVRRSKKCLNSRLKLRALGYPEEPVLYAVRNLDMADDPPEGMAHSAHESMRLTKVVTVNESEFEAIKSFENIMIPYGVIYIDES